MNHTICPRCNIEWELWKDESLCKICGMRFHLFEHGEKTYFLKLGGFNIIWHYYSDNTMQCSYHIDRDDNIMEGCTQCTIIPFDISIDTLKLYLTFS